MDLKDLRYLLAIQETGHLGRAAVNLGITQPALSKCVQRLEKIYGTALLLKVGRGIKLTEAGCLLCDRAQKIVLTLDETHREMDSLCEGKAGFIRLGVAATAAEFMLPTLMNELLKIAPQVRVDVKVGMNDYLQNLLRENRLDLILGFLPAEHDEFARRPLLDDPVVLAASRHHPLGGVHPTPETLAQYNWLLPSTNVATRQWLEQRLVAGGYQAPRIQIQVNSIATLRTVVAQSQLLTFLSRRYLEATKGQVGLVELPMPLVVMPRTFGWQYHSLSELSPIARKLVSIAGKIWVYRE
ncbi:LysR family transcriptional regulator [Tatumella ptyseos]|uniref:LysR family transcriptional regulator n=1 Tax=Tatumella ptyseos TaxID=82987 RepID=UPI0026E9E76E|nr:LysR family transcriptional regulator [Tatumella ptyseos]WKX27014.1 LysR family transcriptional regulator [Tatumella ptyseos]